MHDVTYDNIPELHQGQITFLRALANANGGWTNDMIEMLYRDGIRAGVAMMVERQEGTSA